jgi:uncharacterized membrane protein YeiH
MVFALKFRLPSTAAAALGGLSCFVLRVVSVSQHWNLPKSLR